jgi:hypothetical protein
LQFPKLVDKLKNKDSNFISLLEKWILEVEQVLKKNNIAKVSEIAGLRSKILAPSFSLVHRNTIKKIQLQVAAEVLYDIQNKVSTILLPFENKVNKARIIPAL